MVLRSSLGIQIGHFNRIFTPILLHSGGLSLPLWLIGVPRSSRSKTSQDKTNFKNNSRANQPDTFNRVGGTPEVITIKCFECVSMGFNAKLCIHECIWRYALKLFGNKTQKGHYYCIGCEFKHLWFSKVEDFVSLVGMSARVRKVTLWSIHWGIGPNVIFETLAIYIYRYIYITSAPSSTVTGRPREATAGPLETTGEHRGQFPHTAFGLVHRI